MLARIVTLVDVLSLLGFGSAAAHDLAPDGRGVERGALRVSGMACGACASKVAKEAKQIAGVLEVKVSQPTGRADITFDPGKTSIEAIMKAINHKTPFTAELPPKK